ncbi:histidine phosphatase family protein [Paenisporosarcina sp. TG20]|uniref:histidine phosphatase family protein n=1 Tax=Paenisporosarcina sp. TG20 TaxID=1211706 RepID=UPI001ED912AC|nr:histidine phosphatase family protein [Paenisporosarcina sp. TG20]
MPTLANIERRYIGWSDESISQSSQVYKEATWCPDIINGSDLLRCQETAALFYPKTPYQGSQAFREMSFGDWELRTYEDLKNEVNYQKWLTNPNEVAPPNGEFVDEMGSRVRAGLKSLQCYHPVVVTHGGPIRYVLTQFAPDERDFWSWDVKHGDKWTLCWDSRQCFEEEKRCKSLSVERLTESELM